MSSPTTSRPTAPGAASRHHGRHAASVGRWDHPWAWAVTALLVLLATAVLAGALLP